MDLKGLLAKSAEIRTALRNIDATTGRRTLWTAENQTEVAEFFGVSIDTVKNWAKQRMPGKRGEYRLDLIYQWLHTEGPRAAKAKDDDDPLLAGGSSAALEEYRSWKAKLARLDYEQRNKDLIPRDQVRTVLGRWAMVFRRLGESLGRQFGNEATRRTHDALDECSHIVDYEFGDSNTTDTPDVQSGPVLGDQPGEGSDQASNQPVG